MKTTAAALLALTLSIPAQGAAITVTSFADDKVGCTLRKGRANAINAGAANAECAARDVDNVIQLGPARTS